jgi:hypothetical protein
LPFVSAFILSWNRHLLCALELAIAIFHVSYQSESRRPMNWGCVPLTNAWALARQAIRYGCGCTPLRREDLADFFCGPQSCRTSR